MIWTGIEFGFGLALGVVLFVLLLRHIGVALSALFILLSVLGLAGMLYFWPWLLTPVGIVVTLLLIALAYKDQIATHSPSRSSASSPSQLTPGDQDSGLPKHQGFLPSGPPRS